MVFAQSALEMHRHGLSVLPIGRDRQPLVSGFNRWRGRPSEKTLGSWIERHPSSNIAVHPGLSGVIIVDVDDVSHDADVQKLVGDTPLKVRTRRGLHRYYAATGGRLLGKLDTLGLRADIKAGNAIVIAPPSVHESGHIYARFEKARDLLLDAGLVVKVAPFRQNGKGRKAAQYILTEFTAEKSATALGGGR